MKRLAAIACASLLALCHALPYSAIPAEDEPPPEPVVIQVMRFLSRSAIWSAVQVGRGACCWKNASSRARSAL